MFKKFAGAHYSTELLINTIFTFVGTDYVIGQVSRADLCGTQLFGQIDISKFRSYDFINNVYFLFPIGSHSYDITFKIYETSEYNLETLCYNQISQSDLVDSGIVYENLLSKSTQGEANILLKFDITRLVQKCVKQGREKVCFRVTNNSNTSFTGYYPDGSFLDNEIVVGYFSIPNEEKNKYDSVSLNGICEGSINLVERSLKFDLPVISTKTSVCNIVFTGCIQQSGSGLLGKYGFSNYEYQIKKDTSSPSISQYRYIIKDYRGIESYYILLEKEEILLEYGIVVEPDDVFFNINDLSYITFEGDCLVINLSNNQKIYYNHSNIDTDYSNLHIHHIARYDNNISYNLYFYWSSNKLQYIFDNDANHLVEFNYINNVIESVFFSKERKLIKLSYSSDTPKIMSYKIYKAESSNDIDMNNIIANISFEYKTSGTDYLCKVNDIINANFIQFNYLSDYSNSVGSINHTMGIGDDINYNYDSSLKIATITNRYNEYEKIVFDDNLSPKLVFDKYNNYLGYKKTKAVNGVTLLSKEEVEYHSFNILENSDFSQYQGDIIDDWSIDNFTGLDGVVDNNYLPSIIGTHVVEIHNSLNYPKYIWQEVEISGTIGDSYFVSLWVKGFFSLNNTLKIYVTFVKGDNEVRDFTYFEVCEDFSNFELVSFIATSKINFDKIIVDITSLCINDCYIGNIRCYKKEKGSEYNYKNDGQFDSLTIKGDVIEYRYNDNKVNKIISSTGDSYSISYNDREQIAEINNVNTNYKKECSYDEYGNNTQDKETNNDSKEILLTNEYDDKSNLLVSKDERDFYVFHTYNDYNELIHSVNPSGLSRKLEYGLNGNISKSMFMLNDKKDGASFTYDSQNRLEEIRLLNDTKYKYAYDGDKRLSSFSFIDGNNTKPIINYGYNKTINSEATDLITEKKYFNNNSDKYNYSYNDKRLLTNISYNGYGKYQFTYDDSDRLSQVTDINNDYVTNISYDNNDNLKTREILDSHDIVVFKEEYNYDNNGNIQQRVISSDNEKRSYEYDYKEEYGEYNLNSYLSRLSTSTLNDSVSSVDAISMYGVEPSFNGISRYYNNTIKRKVIRFDSLTTGVVYNCSDINKTRIDGKEYFGLKYNKADWSNAFGSKKGMFGWFRFNTSGTITTKIFTLLPYNKQVELYIYNSFLYIKLYNENTDITTNLQVSPNTWNLIGMCIERNKITVILNDSTFIKDQNINVSASDNTTIEVCYNVNGSTCTDLLYLNIGPYFGFNFDVVYSDGIRYLSGYNVNKTSAVMYYNRIAYENCDVITLNGSFISSDGIRPEEYMMTNPEFHRDKTKIFKYDEDLGRHVYASYSNYKMYYGSTQSSLSYRLPFTTTGAISMWFKLDNGTYSQNRYVFSIENENNVELLSCFITNYNRLHIKSLNNSDSIDIIDYDEWNFVSVTWAPNTLLVGVNGSTGIVGINKSIDVTDAITYIGNKKSSNGTLSSYLEGKIQLVSYSTNELSEYDLYDLEDYGQSIDIRKEYDEDDRLTARKINNIYNTLNTTYGYYEPDNKLNKLPSNEIDYNNIKTIYAYDEEGNIIERRILSGSTIKEKYLYEYNELKQLKKETHYRENNQFDYSYEYEYNINGNRTKATSYDETESILSEDNYTYSSVYKDRLESVTHNNTSLYTFSYQGSNFLNPSSMTKNGNTYSLSWEGRRLSKIGRVISRQSIEGESLRSIEYTTYSYNEEGIRVVKYRPNDETHYYVSGSNVLRSRYNDYDNHEYIIDYHYDESGSLIGFHYDGKEYFYKKDILGIINEIIDEEGTPYVYYKYTAYGIPTSSINTNLSQNKQLIANILLNHNIYIYKDYIYDRDIELYYLNSRYYDPYIGRFISIDAIEYLDFEIVNGLNLYCYCNNNPVMYSDLEGTIITAIIVGAIVGFLSTYISDVVNNIKEDGFQWNDFNTFTNQENVKKYFVNTIAGGLTGLIGGLGMSVLFSAPLSGVVNTAAGVITGDIDVEQMGEAFVVYTLLSFLTLGSQKLASKIKITHGAGGTSKLSMVVDKTIDFIEKCLKFYGDKVDPSIALLIGLMNGVKEW